MISDRPISFKLFEFQKEKEDTNIYSMLQDCKPTDALSVPIVYKDIVSQIDKNLYHRRNSNVVGDE